MLMRQDRVIPGIETQITSILLFVDCAEATPPPVVKTNILEGVISFALLVANKFFLARFSLSLCEKSPDTMSVDLRAAK